MSVGQIMLLAMGIPGFVLLLLGIIFYFKGKSLEKNCISLANGRITRYTLWNSNGVRFPIVEYYVDGIKYKSRLKYKAIITTMKSGLNNIEVKDDISNQTLRVKRSPIVYSVNIFEEKYPIGSEIPVYYNPKNPKKSYVLRYPGTVLPLVFNLTGLGIMLIAVIISVIFWKSPIR